MARAWRWLGSETALVRRQLGGTSPFPPNVYLLCTGIEPVGREGNSEQPPATTSQRMAMAKGVDPRAKIAIVA